MAGIDSSGWGKGIPFDQKLNIALVEVGSYDQENFFKNTDDNIVKFINSRIHRYSGIQGLQTLRDEIRNMGRSS